MKGLGLAFPIEIANSKEGAETVMIPCLIKDEQERKMKEKEAAMEKSNDSVCIMYKFNRNTSTIWTYYRILEVFAKTFLAKKGGALHFAYSQKIEKRRLGTVAGIQGTLQWTNSKSGMQKPVEYSFLLLEFESPVNTFDQQEKKPFALNRGVRFHLQPKAGEMTEDVFSILEKMDLAFAPCLEEVQRGLVCKECFVEEKTGYFNLQKEVLLENEISLCSEEEHSLPEKVRDLMKKKQKPFEMKNLLAAVAEGKSTLNLKPFEESQIKKDMLSGQLTPGEQIWIYHDSQTNPCNPIACINSYAHVVVYTG